MDDLLAEFITDTYETLEQVDVRLVELENEADGTAMLNELFRMMHTIKGTCGFLGLPRMAGLAHAAESLMDRLRNGEPVTHEAVDAMLRVADRLKSILGAIESGGGQEPEGSDEAIIAALNEAGSENAAAPKAEGDEAETEADAEAEAETEAETGAETGAAPAEPAAAGDGGASAAAAKAMEPKKPPATAAANDSAKPAAPKPAPKAEEKSEGGDQSGDRSIRVSVETLEHLMTVVSELVLTRNELTEIMRNEERTTHKLALQRLSTVTGELQQAVMSTRMQPIGNAWRKLPRIVRDVSSNLGKAIDLEMTGANTELDRQVLESIKDPLVHMVRNAADHGLELPSERVAAGKSEKGKISLNAYHEGGQILVEIADDGRGLDVDKIKAKAIERGITTVEEAERMSNEQVYSFIFEPGFSTAAKVTSVSGRGVGMDVVQSNVERIGGSIDVRSAKGTGSVFTLKIPLTLAILRALIVGVDDEDFAIPQTSVDELLKVEPGGPHSIQLIKEAPVLRSRDRLLPVVDLRAVLQLPSAVDENGQPRVADESTRGFVMVMRARGLRFGMLVDTVARTEEIVVKPMPAALRGLEIFSGSTILGDGRVIMIVDPNGVRSAAANPSEAAVQSVNKQAAEVEVEEEKQLLLIFRASTRNRKALPISLITRLEEVSLSDADQSDGQWHIQYNSELIPLVWFGDPPDPTSKERKPLLVMSDAGRSMGLLVDEIVDIVEDNVEVQIPSEQAGILGSAIISGGSTEIIDVSYFLGLASAHWFEPHMKKKLAPGADQILLVDDSIFFRNLVAPVVRSAGFEPVVCSSGPEALDRLEGGLVPSVIVTDVDMPEMDGFAFAKAVRRIERLNHVPILALTGLIDEDAIQRARAAGFSDYISKLDRNGLLQSLRDFTRPRTEEIAA
ncbi:chemotaxis protein CheW [Acuticoccus kandeliae]|uniref:hybrid sensor histidine kinase/response regulator n=1 Tax=Acuticoccus kandeliae TaxID=2073160 RepID=UPI000D3E6515|nr:chemotaxis protein CheW [Acuticoccus kandeliae]